MHTDSTGAQSIEQELITRCINYRKEVPLCPGIRGGILRADFAIYGIAEYPIAIVEFDGPQHRPQRINCVTMDEQVSNDKLKEQFCEDHKINYFRLKTWEADWFGLSKFLDQITKYNPAIVRGRGGDKLRSRTLNLEPVQIESLRYSDYTVDEIAGILNRTPRDVHERYIFILQAIQNWSGKSHIGMIKQTRIAREDFIRFLIEQEALFIGSELITMTHPLAVFHLGDVAPTIKSLVIVTSGKEIGDAICAFTPTNFGELHIYATHASDDTSLSHLMELHSKISSLEFAKVFCGPDLNSTLKKEISGICSSVGVACYT